jgi:hypothetical protein
METNPTNESMNEAAQEAVTRPSGYCRSCGKAVFGASAEQVSRGLVYCEEHQAAAGFGAAAGSPPNAATGSRPNAAAESGANPAGAFLGGLIPGVGAVVNGQYAKGLIHAVIFGFLITVMSSEAVEPIRAVVAMLFVAFYFYMPFEALHTAKKRERGEAVDEFSGLISNDPRSSTRQLAVAGPAVLIGLGVLLLLNNLGVLDSRWLSQVVRTWWPVLLIGLGGLLLCKRLAKERLSEGEAERS